MPEISPHGARPNTNDTDRRPSAEATTNGSHSRSDSIGTLPGISVIAKETKHHDSEPNPFERSFSGNTSKNNGIQTLPGLSNLTSPAVNHTGMSNGPGWSSFGSLRNGPLSPAMLLGPSGLGGFDGTLRTGLTPNESSIRTGLTPRGDASWQLGSPGSIMFNHFGGGTGLTPGGNLSFLSGPGGAGLNDAMFTRPLPPSHLAQDSGLQNDTLQNNGHDADAAASGLFLLSQHSQQQQQQQQKMNGHQNVDDMMRRISHLVKHEAGHPGSGDDIDTSPVAGRRGRRKSSFTDGDSGHDEAKLSKRGRKSSSGNQSDSGNESDENGMMKNGRPQTDEEKRKSFLERNRQAALKCRQRKKQWLVNLQQKVENYARANEELTAQVAGLQDEIATLKSLLHTHKECSIPRNNGNLAGIGHMQQLQY